MLKQLIFALTMILGLSAATVDAQTEKATLNIAVASDFAPTAESLGKEFSAITGIPVQITSGSSQELLQQIKKSVQFDVYMSC